MPVRASVGLGLLAAALLLGLSCSGPSPDPSPPSAPTTNRPQAYHVQLDMTRKKETANRMLGEALQWWDAHKGAWSVRPLTAPGESPVTVAWRAPRYRIRLGPFGTRAQADSVLRAAQSAFPAAFVRPVRAAPSRQ